MTSEGIMNQVGVQQQYNALIEDGMRKSQLFSEYLKNIPTNTKKGVFLRSNLGILYENLCRFTNLDPTKPFNEQTMTAQIASFVNYGFPMIRSIIPNLSAINLVTMQSLPAPNAYIFHLRYKYATEKGRVRKGSSLFDQDDLADTPYDENETYNGFENYASELVDGVNIGSTVLVGGAVISGLSFTTLLNFLTIRPRTAKLYLAFPGDTVNRLLIAEDLTGNGTFTPITSEGVSVTASVDYGSGLFNLSTSTPTGALITIGSRAVSPTQFMVFELDYKYVSEGSKNIPEVDILLNSAPITTEPSPLRVRWSIQSQANFKSQYNLSIQDELSMAIANEIRFEIDTKISQKLKQMAYLPTISELPQFNINPPDGVSYLLHKEQFVQTIFDASSIIEKRSGRGTGNWLICGRRVAALVRNLQDFVPDPFLAGRGIRKIGRLKGMIDIYYDPTYSDVEWVMGHKSDSFLNAGLIYAPYIAFYATPVTTLDDLVSRQAMYSQFALHPVNPRFYVKSRVRTVL